MKFPRWSRPRLLNPAFGWSKFSAGNIPWHKHWWMGLLVDYWISTTIGIVLFAWFYRAKYIALSKREATSN